MKFIAREKEQNRLDQALQNDRYGFFSKSGYKGKAPEDTILYTLKDLFDRKLI